MNEELNELDQLVIGYFGQDHELFSDGETIEEVIDSYISVSHKVNLTTLISDINVYLDLDDKSLEECFNSRYEWEFDPILWDTTAKAFLTDVREQVAAHLKQHHSS